MGLPPVPPFRPIPPVTPATPGVRTVFRDYEPNGAIVVDSDDIPPDQVAKDGSGPGTPVVIGDQPPHDSSNAGLQAQVDALLKRMGWVENGVRVLGTPPYSANGRPPPPMWGTLAGLVADVTTLQARLAAAEGRIQTLEGEVAALKTHHHTYTSGVTYWNKNIHGHPGFGVPQKMVSLITQSQSYSDGWTTSEPRNY